MRWNQIGLRHLRAFLAVAECGSIRQAADRLHVSQPPLGRTIQALEAALGTSLFSRSSSGLKLTEVGRGLYVKLHHVLADLDNLLYLIVENGDSQELRVELSDDTYYSSLGQTIRDYCGDLQNCRLSIGLDYSSRIIDNVMLRKTDIGVIVSPVVSAHTELRSFDLPEVPMYVLVPVTHPLADKSGVYVDELPHEDIVLADMDKNCGFFLKLRSLRLAGDRMTQTVKVWPTQLGIELVKRGSGITILSASAVPSDLVDVRLIPILDEGATLRRSIIWKKEASDATLGLLDYLSGLPSLHDASGLFGKLSSDPIGR